MKEVKEEKKCPCEQCMHGTYMIIEKEWWCDKYLKYASQMERNRRCEKFETISGGDAISRQAVLDIVRFEENWLSDAKSNNADTDIAFSGIRTQVAKLSPVTPARKKEEWIPCSERLPKPNELVDNVRKYYLIQDEYGDMHVASYLRNGWISIDSFYTLEDDVVAWMPLPEPYKE